MTQHAASSRRIGDGPKIDVFSRGGLPDVVRRLDSYNRWRFEPGLGDEPRQDEEEFRRLEVALVEHERAAVRAEASRVPRSAEGFVEWFAALRNSGAGQNDGLFPWLAREASADEMIWFLRQEVAGEAGFEDLVALTQVKMPPQAKLELARNYWDEMGRGNQGGMHGPMLARLASTLGIAHPESDDVVWESLALADVMVGLAVNRRYAFHAVGALGVIELTAPGRAVLVNAGLTRLKVQGEARRYFALHATLDVKHSEAWNREVLAPLVAEDPARAVAIAEGALMRLRAGARCYDRYRQELGLDSPPPLTLAPSAQEPGRR